MPPEVVSGLNCIMPNGAVTPGKVFSQSAPFCVPIIGSTYEVGSDTSAVCEPAPPNPPGDAAAASACGAAATHAVSASARTPNLVRLLLRRYTVNLPLP